MGNSKKVITIIAAIIVLAAAAFVCYEVFIVKRGWVTTGEGTYYYDDYGKAYSGLSNMPDGTVRYFDPATNLLCTGEVNIDGNNYLFDDNGVMLFGLQKMKYYDPQTGIRQVGWIESESG